MRKWASEKLAKRRAESRDRLSEVLDGDPRRGSGKGRLRLFTEEEARFIRESYSQMSLKDLTEAFERAFGPGRTQSQIRAFTRNHKIRSGRTGRFEKGQTPWNAGTRGEGVMRPNRTSFKLGNVPPNRKPLGSERMSKDGFVEIKVAEPNPYTGFPTRYRCKHVVVWERENGPVPEGHVVAFRDGDRLNCDPSNLMLISRAELLRLNQNGYRDLAEELKPSMLALAKLEVKVFGLLREGR